MPDTALKLSEVAELNPAEVLDKTSSTLLGLSETGVKNNKLKFGENKIEEKKLNFFTVILRQFTGNPLIIILGLATFISYFLNEHISSYYIFGMIFLSVALGAGNEYFAEKTIKKLIKKISRTVFVLRNNKKQEIPLTDLAVGDLVFLSAGDLVPADIRLLETDDMEVDEMVLTGESDTVYKSAEVINKQPKELKDYKNIIFMGTSVVSGYGKGVVIGVGQRTQFGKIAKSVSYLKPETDFQKGLSRLGKLLVQVILILSAAIFLINALLGHPLLDSLLFALAIAVGLTPELLPVIVTVSLSFGAGKMAKKHVIVKQLISIENLGNMDILCTDKTGTLTEGKIKVVRFFDLKERDNFEVFKLALICNSAVVKHKIAGNAVDVSLWEHAIKHEIKIGENVRKIFEEPFNFEHQMAFAVADDDNEVKLIAKGAPETILQKCNNKAHQDKIKDIFLKLGNQGYRVIAVAVKKIEKKNSYSFKDAQNLEFKGFITFSDTPKTSSREALLNLKKLGVEVKVITGDNEVVTRKVAGEVGMEIEGVITGREMDKLSAEELAKIVKNHNIFARVTPEQKLKIITALKNNGHTVGFLGDGINDIPSLHCADVGISVDTAIDATKESASVVLLRRSLKVILDGVIEGRRTFANTIKYILMGTSSNFGNMFSAAGASFFLPFLPMTPAQILFTNGLYDISQMTIPSDNVDLESLRKPEHWDINFIKKYMIFFGPISSVYDYLTFGVMLFVFHARGGFFQTGWFIESLATEILVVFVIRTSRIPFYKSKPGILLTIACLLMVSVGIIIPFTFIGHDLGFISPPPLYFIILIILVGTYLLLVEKLKSRFLKKYSI